MTRTLAPLFLGLASIATPACSPRELPPAQPPPREVPTLPETLGPSAPGTSRILLDANGEPALVTERVASTEATGPRGGVIEGEVTRQLCVTPCAVDLTYGLHSIAFTSQTNPYRNGDATVDVRGAPIVVREGLGETRWPHPWASTSGALTGLLGTLAIVPGLALVGAGVAMGSGGSHNSTSDDLTHAGLITLSVGGVLLVSTIVLALIGRPEHVPATTTSWTLEKPAGGAGGS